MSDYQYVGLSVCRTIGVSDYRRIIELSDYRYVGLSTGTNIQLSIAINADNIKLSRSKITPDNIVTKFLKHLTEYCSVANCHVTLLSHLLITVYTSCFSACYQGLIM